MSFKRTKELLPGKYHTHWNLKSWADIIQEHVNLEQSMGGFTENETWDKSTRAREYAQDGRNFISNKSKRT